MAVRMSTHELFGGAILADLPSDYIDASNLREVPDHQEVFLSPSALTSIIFEINVYQTTDAINMHSNISVPTDQLESDQAASSWHFLDPVASEDIVDPGTLTTHPPKVTLAKQSVSRFPAYTQAGTILSPEVDRRTQSVLPQDWQNNPAIISHETRVFQLLVRLKEYDTDLCVRVNVPLKEVTHNASRKVVELRLGEQIIEAVVASLDVKSFELFGSEE